MKEIHNLRAQEIAQALKEFAAQANLDAAEYRKLNNYDEAESADRNAEAINCAAQIILLRGMR